MNKSWQNSPRKLSFEVLLTSEARKMQWNPDGIAIHCETKTSFKILPSTEGKRISKEWSVLWHCSDQEYESR